MNKNDTPPNTPPDDENEKRGDESPGNSAAKPPLSFEQRILAAHTEQQERLDDLTQELRKHIKKAEHDAETQAAAYGNVQRMLSAYRRQTEPVSVVPMPAAERPANSPQRLWADWVELIVVILVLILFFIWAFSGSSKPMSDDDPFGLHKTSFQRVKSTDADGPGRSAV